MHSGTIALPLPLPPPPLPSPTLPTAPPPPPPPPDCDHLWVLDFNKWHFINFGLYIYIIIIIGYNMDPI